jgi:hypothetical protein
VGYQVSCPLGVIDDVHVQGYAVFVKFGATTLARLNHFALTFWWTNWWTIRGTFFRLKNSDATDSKAVKFLPALVFDYRLET